MSAGMFLCPRSLRNAFSASRKGEYSYREIDLYTQIELRKFRNLVTEITDNEVIFNKGVLITDLFGNNIKLPNGLRYTDAHFYIPEYGVGKKWATRFKMVTTENITNDTCAASRDLRGLSRRRPRVDDPRQWWQHYAEKHVMGVAGDQARSRKRNLAYAFRRQSPEQRTYGIDRLPPAIAAMGSWLRGSWRSAQLSGIAERLRIKYHPL